MAKGVLYRLRRRGCCRDANPRLPDRAEAARALVVGTALNERGRPKLPPELEAPLSSPQR